MSTDSPTVSEMRASLAEIIADVDCGLCAWHDIGERVCKDVPVLRALCDLLAAGSQPVDWVSAQLRATSMRMRVAAHRIQDEVAHVAEYLRDAAKVFDGELAAATKPPTANPDSDRTLELVGWYRAYDTWPFGEAKPISSRHEFHNGAERPNDPNDEDNADWEPVYLINTVQATRP